MKIYSHVCVQPFSRVNVISPRLRPWNFESKFVVGIKELFSLWWSGCSHMTTWAVMGVFSLASMVSFQNEKAFKYTCGVLQGSILGPLSVCVRKHHIGNGESEVGSWLVCVCCRWSRVLRGGPTLWGDPDHRTTADAQSGVPAAGSGRGLARSERPPSHSSRPRWLPTTTVHERHL